MKTWYILFYHELSFKCLYVENGADSAPWRNSCPDLTNLFLVEILEN